MSEKGEQFREFLKELKPAISEPFEEHRKLSPPEKERLESKLAVLREEEKIAERRCHFLEAAGLKDYIDKLDRRLKEHGKGKFNFIFSEAVRGVSFFKNLPVLREFYKFLRNVHFDYFANQKEGEAIRIDTQLDAEIPLKEARLKDYLSFVPYWIAGVLFAKREFGDAAQGDAARILSDMAGFYSEAGLVYKIAQTTFHRPAAAGKALKFVRFLDKDKNLFPSMHVEIAGNTYSRMTDIIDKYARDPEDYALVKERIFKRAVRIMEACLFVKQHGWRDVSASLAALSARDPAFTKDRARKLVSGMFAENTEDVGPRLAMELRREMISLYESFVGKLAGDQGKDYTKLLIEYVRGLK